MSGDEFLVLCVTGVLAVVAIWRWYRAALTVTPLASRTSDRFAVHLAPPLAVVLLLVVLRLWSSWDVKSSALYTVFYLVMGIAWFGLVVRLLPLVGYHPRDDVIERRNRAAAPVVLGAALGGTLAFAGANIGDGPGWWVVVFCAALATVTMFLLVAAVEALVHPAEAVTIDRDPASGLRQGGLFLALGLILGRSVAGDWHSTSQTIADFAAVGWPAAVIAAAAALFHVALHPTPERPRPDPWVAGLVPATLYLLGAAWGLADAGWWE